MQQGLFEGSTLKYNVILGYLSHQIWAGNKKVALIERLFSSVTKSYIEM